jgi:CubicO group peptidase (beta-lactamase class C family)
MIKSRIIKWIAILLGLLVGALALFILTAMIVYPPQYVLRLLAWRESDAFDWQKFPERTLQPAPTTAPFGQRPDTRLPELLGQLAGTDDWDAFMQATQTQAFHVIQDGDVLYEGYFNDTQPNSIVTSFSVAKSFTSALVGIAIDEGYIVSVNDPVTSYLPELADRDPRFEDITIRDLLMMASGLDYQANRAFLFNGDDPLTTYYPNQREISLENTRIIDPPGAYFSYNKYHP